MFDLTSRITYKNVPKWHRDITRVSPGIPIVLAGNKADDGDRKFRHHDIEYGRNNNMPFFEISVLTNYQFELPFLTLLRELLSDPYLELTKQPEGTYEDILYNINEVGS